MFSRTELADHMGLYIHIPFCRAKCHYCDFNSKAGMEGKITGYMEMLKRETGLYSEKLKNDKIGSIFIGGGTPSLVEPKEIAGLMKVCFDNFNIIPESEITIESNPGTLDREKLAVYKNAGINRLSMGLQAWQDNLLQRIGRIHTRSEFLTNLQEAKKAGFENINADLIFGLPGQKLEDWIETVNNILKLELKHISCYSLKVEEGTRFYEEYEKETLVLPDEEIEREMYRYAIVSLGKAGYKHYEISNFALDGYECRHNMLYWTGGRYIGLGTGAHSYFGGNRFNNFTSINKYEEAIKNGLLPIDLNEMCSIDKEESMKEFMLLGLRMIRGVNKMEFDKTFGKDMAEVFKDEIKKLVNHRLLEWDGSNLRLTERGLDLANEAFLMFV